MAASFFRISRNSFVEENPLIAASYVAKFTGRWVMDQESCGTITRCSPAGFWVLLIERIISTDEGWAPFAARSFLQRLTPRSQGTESNALDG